MMGLILGKSCLINRIFLGKNCTIVSKRTYSVQQQSSVQEALTTQDIYKIRDPTNKQWIGEISNYADNKVILIRELGSVYGIEDREVLELLSNIFICCRHWKQMFPNMSLVEYFSLWQIDLSMDNGTVLLNFLVIILGFSAKAMVHFFERGGLSLTESINLLRLCASFVTADMHLMVHSVPLDGQFLVSKITRMHTLWSELLNAVDDSKLKTEASFWKEFNYPLWGSLTLMGLVLLLLFGITPPGE